MLRIEELTNSNRSLLNSLPTGYSSTHRLNVVATGFGTTLRFDACPPYTKTYDRDQMDVSSLIKSDHKTAFLAIVNGTLAGQIIAWRYWNNYCHVEDVVVAPEFRRQGIGTRLMDQVVRWAREHGLPGVRLETQDTNAPACHWYAKYGFEIGGYDRRLYTGIDPAINEIAVYFYLLF